jgi:hypothetical protein
LFIKQKFCEEVNAGNTKFEAKSGCAITPEEIRLLYTGKILKNDSQSLTNLGMKWNLTNICAVVDKSQV